MVEDRVTDGDRILTLLRAEIEGRETAGLDRLSIVESGDRAALSADKDSAVIDDDGRVLATLEPTPDGLALQFQIAGSLVREHAGDAFLTVDETDGQVLVSIPTAAAVKRAVDLLVAVSGN